jgi:hypothetical protein
MSNDRINELPIVAKLNKLSSAIRAEFDAATLGGLSVAALDCAAPMAEAAALIKELVEALEEIGASNIRPGSRYNERLAREYERVQRVARAALAKARAQ